MFKVFILRIGEINVVYLLSEQKGRYYRIGEYQHSIQLIIDLLDTLKVEYHIFHTLGERELIRMIKIFHSGFLEGEIKK